MSSTGGYVLYGLASVQNVCASPNVWRVRHVLAYKQIPYRSEFLELPDIAPFCKSRGLIPNEAPDKPYTVPVLQLLDGTYVMNSIRIVEVLQKLHPQPTLGMGDYDRVRSILRKLMHPLFCLFAPPALELFHPESRAHWAKSVTPPGAASLQAWLSEQDPAVAWSAAETALQELKQLLDEHSGSYLQGHKPTYADMVLAASCKTDELICAEVLAELEKRIPAVSRHLDACRQWEGNGR